MQYVFQNEDVRQLKEGETYEGKFVVIRLDSFKPQYRSAKYQLFYATGGFGCDPQKMGNAVFGADCSEHYRQERYNIVGVATDEAIEEWEKVYGINRSVLIKNATGR